MNKEDIRNKEDIALLVNSFYEKVRKSDRIGYIFNDVVKVDWDHHLPIMYDFWENVLFHTGNYNRNVVAIHKNLHRLTTLDTDHFAEWLGLWKETIDDLFAGTNAELMKQRATSISTVMQISIFYGGISPGVK